MDKILIDGLKIYAYHGVNPEEKAGGQNFILNITCEADLRVPSLSDDVDDTVSYSKVIKEATRIFLSEKDDLIECAARRVAVGILQKFEKLQSVTVLLKKPEAPVKADFNFVAVEITVRRDEL